MGDEGKARHEGASEKMSIEVTLYSLHPGPTSPSNSTRYAASNSVLVNMSQAATFPKLRYRRAALRIRSRVWAPLPGGVERAGGLL